MIEHVSAWWPSLPTLTVGIPWRPKPDRLGPYKQVTEWYAARGFNIVAVDGGRADQPFNISASRNELVRQILERNGGAHLPVILSDADTMPEFSGLVSAIGAVLRDADEIQLPYHLYERADIPAGNRREPRFVDGACSGVMVFKPASWLWLGGQDERFRGWGFEDTAFRLAHETLIGPLGRHVGIATALRHTPAGQGLIHANRRRYELYRDAYGDQDAMRALVGEPIHFKSTVGA